MGMALLSTLCRDCGGVGEAPARPDRCPACGSPRLLAHAELRLGCSAHGTSKNGKFTLEPAFCLGLCASSPAMTINEEPHARMTPRSFDALVAQYGDCA